MPNPTHAPLTDEQIDVHLRAIRECYDGDADAVIAAVVAKAKREERERFDSALRAVAGAGYFRAFTEEMNRREATNATD